MIYLRFFAPQWPEGLVVNVEIAPRIPSASTGSIQTALSFTQIHLPTSSATVFIDERLLQALDHFKDGPKRKEDIIVLVLKANFYNIMHKKKRLKNCIPNELNTLKELHHMQKQAWIDATLSIHFLVDRLTSIKRFFFSIDGADSNVVKFLGASMDENEYLDHFYTELESAETFKNPSKFIKTVVQRYYRGVTLFPHKIQQYNVLAQIQAELSSYQYIDSDNPLKEVLQEINHQLKDLRNQLPADEELSQISTTSPAPNTASKPITSSPKEDEELLQKSTTSPAPNTASKPITFSPTEIEFLQSFRTQIAGLIANNVPIQELQQTVQTYLESSTPELGPNHIFVVNAMIEIVEQLITNGEIQKQLTSLIQTNIKELYPSQTTAMLIGTKVAHRPPLSTAQKQTWLAQLNQTKAEVLQHLQQSLPSQWSQKVNIHLEIAPRVTSATALAYNQVKGTDSIIFIDERLYHLLQESQVTPEEEHHILHMILENEIRQTLLKRGLGSELTEEQLNQIEIVSWFQTILNSEVGDTLENAITFTSILKKLHLEGSISTLEAGFFDTMEQWILNVSTHIELSTLTGQLQLDQAFHIITTHPPEGVDMQTFITSTVQVLRSA